MASTVVESKPPLKSTTAGGCVTASLKKPPEGEGTAACLVCPARGRQRTGTRRAVRPRPPPRIGRVPWPAIDQGQPTSAELTGDNGERASEARLPALQVRPAGPSDQAFLIEMWYLASTPVRNQAGELEPSFEELWGYPAARRGVVNFGQRDSDFGLIAEAGGRPVGAAWWRKLKTIADLNDLPRFERYMTIAVAPEYQNCGVGSLLIKSLLEEAHRREDVHEVGLMVKEGNTVAIRLYQGIGFRARGRGAGMIAMSCPTPSN